VDIAPLDGHDIVDDIQLIQQELEQFDSALVTKPCWLVFTKIDALPEEDADRIIADCVKRLAWTRPVYKISSVRQEGTADLCQALMVAMEDAS
jgi:Predicted GTPase